jgi:hypothetical protein
MPPRKRVERWKEEPGKVTRVPKRAPGGGLTEKAFQQQVVDLCNWAGLFVYHTYDSRRSVSGWPDLVIVGPDGILYRELKTEVGKLAEDQKRVLGLLRAAGADTSVWRPSDMAMGIVKAELRAIGGRLK